MTTNSTKMLIIVKTNTTIKINAVYLFAHIIDGPLDVSEVHSLNITNHWYNKPLHKCML